MAIGAFSSGFAEGFDAVVITVYTEEAEGGGVGGGSSPFYYNQNVFSLNFNYNIGEQPKYWFRVSGKCQPLSAGDNCAITDTTCSTNGASTFNQNVLASDVSEVCQYLQSVGWDWPIARIQKFTKPAQNKFVDSSNDCNALVDVPFADVPKCINLALHTNGVAHLSVQTYLEEIKKYSGQASLEAEPSGSYSVTSGGSATTDFYYHGGASISVEPDGDYESLLDLGLTVDISASADLYSIELISAENVDNGVLEAPTTGIFTACGQCDSLPPSLKLNHNFQNAFLFKNFCLRNKIVVANPLVLNYSHRTGSWKGSLYYSGIADNDSQLESWRILVEWGCTNSFAGQLSGGNFWQFNCSFFRKNLTNKSDSDTRLQIAFPAINLCDANSELEFDFGYNVQKLFVSTNRDIVVDNHLFYDKIGMFKNNEWLKKPLLKFNISQTASSDDFELQNIKGIFPK